MHAHTKISCTEMVTHQLPLPSWVEGGPGAVSEDPVELLSLMCLLNSTISCYHDFIPGIQSEDSRAHVHWTMAKIHSELRNISSLTLLFDMIHTRILTILTERHIQSIY